LNQNKPIFTLIAGINGAGKSTSYDYMDDDEKTALGPRINPDELTLELGSIVAGGKEASKIRRRFLFENITFHQETTLTGKSILKIIDQAKKQGYRLNLIYVGLNSVDLAIERVRYRAVNGGHDIPKQDIIRRYPDSLKNLSEQIHKFDSVRIMDNTTEFTTVFQVINGRVVSAESSVPKWAQSAIEAYRKHHKYD